MSDDITAADSMVHALVEHGVDTVFGLPGVQTYALFDALHRQQDKIKTIGARHEQGVAYMAYGYARSTGRLGVFACVPGPGVLNTTAAMCTAQGAGAPVLCLTGEVPSGYMGLGRRHLHELTDQLGVLQRLAKYAEHVSVPDDAAGAVSRAIGEATTAPTGAAAVSVCWDHFGASVNSRNVPDPVAQAVAPVPPRKLSAVKDAARLIEEARQIIIFVGSGAYGAEQEILELANLLNAPVVANRGGRGILAEDHALSLSIAGAYKLWPKTDLIIGIGTHLEVPFMRWSSPQKVRRSWQGRKLLRIDIDAGEMKKLDTDAALIGDSKDCLQSLLSALSEQNFTSALKRSDISKAREVSDIEIQSVQPQMAYLEVIREHLPRDGYLVEELCQVGYTSYFGFPVYHPRTYISAGFQGTLGYGFPTALGVKAAHPDKVVVSISGDGGFMFGVAELATAVQYKLNVVAIVFNNSAYGNVYRDQQTVFDNRTIGSALENPDFVELAKSFGARGFRVSSPQELAPVLASALQLDECVVIEVVIERGSEARPWKFVVAPEIELE